MLIMDNPVDLSLSPSRMTEGKSKIKATTSPSRLREGWDGGNQMLDLNK